MIFCQFDILSVNYFENHLGFLKVLSVSLKLH